MNKLVKQPIKIGLTGGIGSGKTTVSKIFKNLGVPIFNSDDISKKILKTDKQIFQIVKKEFGNSIIKNNEIDRKELGKIVFSNKSKLNLLNSIIHPIVLKNFHVWILKQTTRYIIKESAILFESDNHKELDKIIVVKAPLNLRIKRISNRDQRSHKETQAIINNQFKLNDIKIPIDYVINNNEKQLLIPQVISIHNTLSIL